MKRYECLGLCYLVAEYAVHPKAGSGSSTAGALIGDSVWLRGQGELHEGNRRIFKD